MYFVTKQILLFLTEMEPLNLYKIFLGLKEHFCPLNLQDQKTHISQNTISQRIFQLDIVQYSFNLFTLMIL